MENPHFRNAEMRIKIVGNRQLRAMPVEKKAKPMSREQSRRKTIGSRKTCYRKAHGGKVEQLARLYEP